MFAAERCKRPTRGGGQLMSHGERSGDDQQYYICTVDLHPNNRKRGSSRLPAGYDLWILKYAVSAAARGIPRIVRILNSMYRTYVRYIIIYELVYICARAPKRTVLKKNLLTICDAIINPGGSCPLYRSSGREKSQFIVVTSRDRLFSLTPHR